MSPVITISLTDEHIEFLNNQRNRNNRSQTIAQLIQKEIDSQVTMTEETINKPCYNSMNTRFISWVRSYQKSLNNTNFLSRINYNGITGSNYYYKNFDVTLREIDRLMKFNIENCGYNELTVEDMLEISSPTKYDNSNSNPSAEQIYEYLLHNLNLSYSNVSYLDTAKTEDLTVFLDQLPYDKKNQLANEINSKSEGSTTLLLIRCDNTLPEKYKRKDIDNNTNLNFFDYSELLNTELIQIEDVICDVFSIAKEQQTQTLPQNRKPIYLKNIHYALAKLEKDGFITKIKSDILVDDKNDNKYND